MNNDIKTLEVGRPIDINHPITVPFGEVDKRYWATYHTGTDFGAKRNKKGNKILMDGSPVKSATDGIVQIMGVDPTGIIGLRVWVLTKLKNGNEIRAGYWHLQSINDLHIGKQIKRGDIIAYSGHSGTRRDGTPNPSHLHFVLESWPLREPIKPIFV